MKSKLIIEAKKKCENTNNITFVTFTYNDVKQHLKSVEVFNMLEDPFKNGIVLTFTHNVTGKKPYKFMTIVFCDSILNHWDLTLDKILRMLVGKQIRLYKGIFSLDYFDFEDQCFPSKLFKVKNN